MLIFPYEIKRHGAGWTLSVENAEVSWSCPYPGELEDGRRASWLRVLEPLPHRLLVWFACDCAERQHLATRDREEMEVVITRTVRRWAAELEPAESCAFPWDETVQSTQASWLAAQAVLARPEDKLRTPADCVVEVVGSVPPGSNWEGAERWAGPDLEAVTRRIDERRWQAIRLAVLQSLPADTWEDPSPFQASWDMSEEQFRPWSECFLELMGVPRQVWNPK